MLHFSCKGDIAAGSLCLHKVTPKNKAFAGVLFGNQLRKVTFDRTPVFPRPPKIKIQKEIANIKCMFFRIPKMDQDFKISLSCIFRSSAWNSQSTCLCFHYHRKVQPFSHNIQQTHANFCLF